MVELYLEKARHTFVCVYLLRCFCCYDYFNIFSFFFFLFYSPEFGGGRWRRGDDIIMTSLPKHCVHLLLHYQINFINYNTMCELVNNGSIGKSVACMAVRTLQNLRI